jgi:hypothetical protein
MKKSNEYSQIQHNSNERCPRCGYRRDDRIQRIHPAELHQRRLLTALSLLTELDITDVLRPSELETAKSLSSSLYQRYRRVVSRREAQDNDAALNVPATERGASSCSTEADSHSSLAALCHNAIRKLQAQPDGTLPHSVLLKRMKITAAEFHNVVEALEQRGWIERVRMRTAGRPSLFYRLSSRLRSAELSQE